MRNLLVLLLVLAGCPQAPANPTNPPKPGIINTVDCPAAATHLKDLHCPNGRGGFLGDDTKKGKSWEQLCQDDAENGVDLHPGCIVGTKSCAEVEACER